jgi:hypothetical protein
MNIVVLFIVQLVALCCAFQSVVFSRATSHSAWRETELSACSAGDLLAGIDQFSHWHTRSPRERAERKYFETGTQTGADTCVRLKGLE